MTHLSVCPTDIQQHREVSRQDLCHCGLVHFLQCPHLRRCRRDRHLLRVSPVGERQGEHGGQCTKHICSHCDPLPAPVGAIFCDWDSGILSLRLRSPVREWQVGEIRRRGRHPLGVIHSLPYSHVRHRALALPSLHERHRKHGGGKSE